MSGAAAPALPEMLGRLKLTAMRDRLDVLLDEAARRELNLPEALGLLCAAEVAHREERRIQMGLSIAKFPYVRTLEGFDFAAQPSLDPKQVRELAACRWVANGDTLLVQGPPGVGKSHIAVALGREAVQRGYSVLFTSAMGLITDLMKAQAEGRLEEKLGTVRNFVWDRDDQVVVKRSSKRMANCALAAVHSLAGILHSLAARFKTRNNSFSTALSVGKWPRALTARRSLAFRASMELVTGM